MQLPARVKAGLKQYYPETGSAWLESYPDFLTRLLEKWGLVFDSFAPEGWPTNVVLFVTTNSGESLVMKLGHPHEEAETERLYLTVHESGDVVRLLDSEPGYALLMERVVPGTTLRQEILNSESIRTALILHGSLPMPVVDLALPTFKAWLEKAFAEARLGQDDALFQTYCNRAMALFEKIEGPDVLLHGDLHHENILRGRTGWRVIDPKGVLGPAVMEFGRFLHNFLADEIVGPFTQSASRQVLTKRICEAAEVSGYSQRQLTEVTFIDLTLSVCWCLNGGESSEQGMVMLAALNQMLDGNP